MNRIKEILAERKILLIVMLISVCLVLLPYTKEGLFVGDDVEFHLGRIQALADSLQNKEFPVKIYADMAQTYGYGAGFFYPSFFIYIPAVFILLGMDLFCSYKIFILLMTVLLFVVTYYSFKYITQETNSALIGTVLVVTARIVSINLFNRFAIGEYLGYIFLPLVVAGLYDLSDKDFQKPWLLFLGFFGVMNTHIITALIAIVYAVVYFVFTIRKMTLRKFLKLLLVAILTVLVTSFFWAPMLEQMNSQVFKYTKPWNSIENESYDLYDSFSNSIRSFGLMFTILFPVLIYAIFDKRISKKAKCFILGTCLLILIMITPAFWELLKDFVQVIQFKWRLLGLGSVLMAISLAIVLKEYGIIYEIKIERILALIVILSVFIVIVFNNGDMVTRHGKAEDYENIRYNKGVLGIGCEYLPIETDYSKFDAKNKASDEDGNTIEIVKRNLQSEFKVTKDVEYVELPYIYYYGYVGNIVDGEGNVEPIEIDKTDNGQIKAITNGKDGHVFVWYHGTKIQKISYLVSAFTFVVVFAYTVIQKIRKKDK